MTWQKRGKRKGKRRLPESQRQRVIKTARQNNAGCYFNYYGICGGIDGAVPVEVHHIIDAEDGGSDDDDNLVAACAPCHTRYSAQQSQKRAAAAAWDFKRKPERHPGVID